ncbi:MAG: hypothetical protein Q4G46_12110 [Propionibacteriaceae bacterium]|nr:hypothetical protein [Propionibacteriaceae bacterium]
MATWEDGPEYAPAARPLAFDPPAAVAPLERTPPREVPSAGAPVTEPSFNQRGDLRSLAEHLPDPGELRDPTEPYAVASSVMTETDSAWSTVIHYHVQPGGASGPSGLPAEQWAPPSGSPVAAAPPPPDPRMPFTVSGRDAAVGSAGAMGPVGPGPVGQGGVPQAEWLPPGHVPSPRTTPTVDAVFNAVTAPTFITLLLGGLAMAVPMFGWLSPLMFIMAFLTSGRIALRRHWVRLAFLVGSGALGTSVLLGAVFASPDWLAYFELVQAVSTVACWLVLLSVVGIVWQALAAGEQPQHPPTRRSGWI